MDKEIEITLEMREAGGLVCEELSHVLPFEELAERVYKTMSMVRQSSLSMRGKHRPSFWASNVGSGGFELTKDR